MEMEAWVLIEPVFDFLGFVGAVIIGNAVNGQMFGRVAVNGSDEFQEFLMAMLGHAAANNLAIKIGRAHV